MKPLRNYKIKASSLIESVMAIAVISICVFIATLIYVKLLETDYELAYYKAKQKVNELHLETFQEQSFEDEYYDFTSYKIDKKVLDFSDNLKEVMFNIQTETKQETFKFLVKIEVFEEDY